MITSYVSWVSAAAHPAAPPWASRAGVCHGRSPRWMAPIEGQTPPRTLPQWAGLWLSLFQTYLYVIFYFVPYGHAGLRRAGLLPPRQEGQVGAHTPRALRRAAGRAAAQLLAAPRLHTRPTPWAIPRRDSAHHPALASPRHGWPPDLLAHPSGLVRRALPAPRPPHR
jgi:hypothetical protein